MSSFSGAVEIFIGQRCLTPPLRRNWILCLCPT